MSAPDAPKSLIPRYLTQRVRTALEDTPVVLINGPKQCGKTTLVRDLLGDDRDYLSLDDETILAGARGDPVGLIRRLDRSAPAWWSTTGSIPCLSPSGYSPCR